MGTICPARIHSGDGFWRRLIPIGFDAEFPEAERVGDLDRVIIKAELAGVLNWALEGFQEWRRIGLAVPASIKTFTEEYRRETDVLGEWLQEFCDIVPGARTKVADAFRSYRDFCDEQNTSPGTKALFSRNMTSRGVRRSPSTSVRAFLDLQLKERSRHRFEPDDDAGDEGDQSPL